MEKMTRQPVPDGRGVKQGETVHQACWYVERGVEGWRETCPLLMYM